MRHWFSRLLGAFETIADTLGGIADSLHGLSTERPDMIAIESRLAAVELEMAKRFAEAEGLLLKAEGKFNAARAAEERTRRLAGGDEESEESQLDALIEAAAGAGVPEANGIGGGADELYPVSGRLAGRHESKQNAYAMKFGRR